MATAATELLPHPARPFAAIRRINATAEWPATGSPLRIRFRVEGDVGRLKLPTPGAARRLDGLWQHSCFEAFLRPDASDIYYEFNFAPSGDWAAYRFAGRRSGRSSPELAEPAIRTSLHAGIFELTAEIDVAALPELARAGTIRAGLTAVVESDAGALSYWAFAHGGGQPDFHDPSTFLLVVTRP